MRGGNSAGDASSDNKEVGDLVNVVPAIEEVARNRNRVRGHKHGVGRFLEDLKGGG